MKKNQFVLLYNKQNNFLLRYDSPPDGVQILWHCGGWITQQTRVVSQQSAESLGQIEARIAYSGWR